MIVERMFTARFYLADVMVGSETRPTEGGSPQKLIEYQTNEIGKITLDSWRLRGPVKVGADSYDYVPLRTPVSPEESRLTGAVAFHFSHPDFESFTIIVDANVDGEPKIQYDLNRNQSKGVSYDDPKLIIEPDPRSPAALAPKP